MSIEGIPPIIRAQLNYMLSHSPSAIRRRVRHTEEEKNAEIMAIRSDNESLKPSWFTPKRLLVIFCMINLINYIDRGAIASNGVNGSLQTCTESGVCSGGSGIHVSDGQVIGQKLITDVLKPSSSESSGVSPEKKVRKMRASPFNKKSSSVLGRKQQEEEHASPASEGNADSNSAALESVVEEPSAELPPRPRRAAATRKPKNTIVLRSSEDDEEEEEEQFEDSDFSEDDDY